ncbi:MAG: quinolinate synthase NadA [Candidatus Euphemobacter frigidus]|nr:quinolinate synthase NadA [Candidatus Euphemobacter frigidus]MDP8275465.1 quinolinate synthase NadA [Candidatus Euphemobacter frigidus]
MSNQSIIKKIEELKKKRKAVILVHNYQTAEIQEVADFLGDSLDLSRRAAATDAAVIVFCGVSFMAETAAILAPEKLVLIPDPAAGCPMADMITAENLRDLKSEHPGAIVVAYVNSSAAVKAETDICCTSANAVDVVASLPRDREVIFVPDKFLGAYVMKKTGRALILCHGYCPVHRDILPEAVVEQRRLHPHALVMVHPECPPEVIDLADEALSTSGMVRVARESDREEFIVGTEVDMLVRLRRENSDKRFYPANPKALCVDMKKITLEKVLRSLEEEQFEIVVPEEIRRRARRAVDAMVDGQWTVGSKQ